MSCTQNMQLHTKLHKTLGSDTPPQWPPFSQPTGAQTSLPSTASPEDFFAEIFSTEIWDLLVAETNNYAQHKIHTTPPFHRGILSTWHNTTRDEMMAFVGLILAMGTIQLPDIKDYWARHETLNLSFFWYKHCSQLEKMCTKHVSGRCRRETVPTPAGKNFPTHAEMCRNCLHTYTCLFSHTCKICKSTIPLYTLHHRSVMPRDRFLQLFWNLHLCSPSASAGSPRATKVQSLLDLLCPRFESAFKLGEFVAVDEAMIAFRGRASFRQYVCGKPHPYRIKAFFLADSATGYVHRFRLYFSKETNIIHNPSLLQTTRTVLTLTEPLQGLRHHIITNWFYTSPELAVELESQGLPFTGTVQVNRRGMPLAMKSGERQLQ